MSCTAARRLPSLTAKRGGIVPVVGGQAVVQAVLSKKNRDGENSDDDEPDDFTLSGLQEEVDADQRQKKVG